MPLESVTNWPRAFGFSDEAATPVIAERAKRLFYEALFQDVLALAQKKIAVIPLPAKDSLSTLQDIGAEPFPQHEERFHQRFGLDVREEEKDGRNHLKATGYFLPFDADASHLHLYSLLFHCHWPSGYASGGNPTKDFCIGTIKVGEGLEGFRFEKAFLRGVFRAALLIESTSLTLDTKHDVNGETAAILKRGGMEKVAVQESWRHRFLRAIICSEPKRALMLHGPKAALEKELGCDLGRIAYDLAAVRGKEGLRPPTILHLQPAQEIISKASSNDTALQGHPAARAYLALTGAAFVPVRKPAVATRRHATAYVRAQPAQ